MSINSKTVYFIFGIIIVFLNYIDAYLTLHYTSLQIVEETNPLMDFLLLNGHNAFVFYKCVIVPFFTAIILYHLHLKISKPAIIIISIVYLKLIIYWFVNLNAI